MTISRRRFMKSVAGGGGALLASRIPCAQATMSTELPSQAVGILYDATLCVGCKSCMVNCKKTNSVPGGALYNKGMTAPPYESGELSGKGDMWDAPQELSGKTLNIIKVYKNGTAATKDTAVNGYAFFKQQCLHCISPACASVCPAGAFRKDPENGAVYYLASKCIGCRYCQLACPFGVPRYEWDSAWPEVRKCQLCNHRYKEGKYAACAEYCPTGATVFGKVRDLRAEARQRLALKPGQEYEFPLQTVNSRERTRREMAHYINHVYGLTEAGGTQNLMLSGVPFDLLGFRKNIANFDLPSLTWAYIAKIPWVFAGVFLGGTALYKLTHRKDKEGSSHD
ncbi:hydrogenase 2 operon protein HybA [Geobacter sp. SVR]|uniref:hydrogenase 2 operon protein HybA n=1 Tax=Geobacter sp. SVR TaxID=2495594 RepID=UPI00143EF7BD|nr:hydrogenase 2 operon protein HybA [Geobacter sp. SVR]BCS52167.1 hydrogenase [Geobacter sp. SVR]GCF86622.1 hydrogenase [Geobacter sp. SVR]